MRRGSAECRGPKLQKEACELGQLGHSTTLEQVSAYAPFASRNYRFLISGLAISMMGHMMLGTAAAWDIYHLTRDPIALGNVGLAQIIPVFLFTFITGQVAD